MSSTSIARKEKKEQKKREKKEMKAVPDITNITGNIFVGNRASMVDEATLTERNIKAAISIVRSPEDVWSETSFHDRVPHHIWIEALDSSTQELLKYMPRCCEFIDDNSDAGILIHCEMGWSRSVTIVIAYLMRKNKWRLKPTLKYMEEKRNINVSKNFKEQLWVWETCKYHLCEDYEGEIPKPAYRKWLDANQVELKKLGLTGNDSFRMLTPCGMNALSAWAYNKKSKNVIKKRLTQQHPSDFFTERHFGATIDMHEPYTVEGQLLRKMLALCSTLREQQPAERELVRKMSNFCTALKEVSSLPAT